jgi:hypothetical protein
MLLQSRASRVSDVLTLKDTDEIAASPPGAVQDAITRKIREEIREVQEHSTAAPTRPIASLDAGESGGKIKYVTIRNGKAEFDRS